MDAFVKMDIFFLITTVAVIVIAIFVSVLLFYILRTARDVSEVVRIVRKESERFTKGTSAARARIKSKGEGIVQSFVAFVQTLAPTKKRDKNKVE